MLKLGLVLPSSVPRGISPKTSLMLRSEGPRTHGLKFFFGPSPTKENLTRISALVFLIGIDLYIDMEDSKIPKAA